MPINRQLSPEKFNVSVLVALLFLLTSIPVQAQGEAALRTFGEFIARLSPLIALAIIYLSRRQAIGSWLLWYYIQLYIGIALTTWFFTRGYQNLTPSAWDSANRYVMFLLSCIPLQIARMAEVIVGTWLLRDRTNERLKHFRWVLVAVLITSLTAAGIDVYFFSRDKNLSLNVFSVGFSITWLAYFMLSKRVRLVFEEGNWSYSTDAENRVLSSDDRRRLRRRALIASSITFVVLLIVIGISQGEKKPDAAIFIGPLICAALAALIAWYLPLRKRRSDIPIETHSRTSEP